MGKRKPAEDPEQAALDTQDVLECVNRWAEAQELVRQIEDEIAALATRANQLRRRHKEAKWDAAGKWRRLRRAQGYDVD